VSKGASVKLFHKCRFVGDRFAGGNEGFTLIEVLVACVVLAIGLMAIMGFFASSIARVLDSRTRSVLQQVATEDLEKIRALKYDDVGTTTGQPPGVLLAHEERTVQGRVVTIDRQVRFIQDQSYTGPYPANYRRVTISVSDKGDTRLGPVEMTSNVAGGAPGGSLDVTVQDSQGNPVPDVPIKVTNNHLVPSVNINDVAIRTDSLGHLLIPGLTPDSEPAYVVTGTKTGYNSDDNAPGVVVNDGLPYTNVPLIMDKLSNLIVRLVDPGGAAKPGVALTITGPENFTWSGSSDSSGTVTLRDIRFAKSNDPYNVVVTPGQGYEPVSKAISVDAGSTKEETLTLISMVTTTVPGTTTTTAPRLGTLTVTVLKDSNGQPLKNATVNLINGGGTKNTDNSGQVVYSGLAYGDYPLSVARNNYQTYSTTVTINGSVSLTIRLRAK
jgi:prepilin-type N-terminal cleavage/methylation domain-containing protein